MHLYGEGVLARINVEQRPRLVGRAGDEVFTSRVERHASHLGGMNAVKEVV